MMAPKIMGEGNMANRDRATTCKTDSNNVHQCNGSCADLYCEGQRLVADVDTPEGHQDVAHPAGAAEDGEDGHGDHPVDELGLTAGDLAPALRGLRDGLPGQPLPGLLQE